MEPVTFAIIGLAALGLRISKAIKHAADRKRILNLDALQKRIKAEHPNCYFVKEQPAKLFLRDEGNDELAAFVRGDQDAGVLAEERVRFIQEEYYPKCDCCHRPLILT
jgi:hypothetical protein